MCSEFGDGGREESESQHWRLARRRREEREQGAALQLVKRVAQRREKEPRGVARSPRAAEAKPRAPLEAASLSAKMREQSSILEDVMSYMPVPDSSRRARHAVRTRARAHAPGRA